MANANCAECTQFEAELQHATRESIRLDEHVKFNPEDAQAELRANEGRIRVHKLRQAYAAHCAEMAH